MKYLLIGVSAIALLSSGLGGCTSSDSTSSTDTTEQTANSTEKGTLMVVANGEDFIRQGFVTKDGWQIEFDNAYVTVSDITAYQTDPPFDPDTKGELKAKESVVLLEKPKTIDLAQGNDQTPTITVNEVEAPSGVYNALTWKLVRDTQDPDANYSIVLTGMATKEQTAIPFILQFDQELDYVCGEFVGDERKGYLTANDTAGLETTFHFDHLFGDADTPADDPLNTDALGFEPLAQLATDGELTLDQTQLKQKLSSEDYQKLETAIAGLGHVGEGHCRLQ